MITFTLVRHRQDGADERDGGMSVKHDFMTVGKDKNGQMDFGIRASICDLTLEEMNDLRAMICAAIGTMEDMWRRERHRNDPGQVARLPSTVREPF